jgi:ornithine carbamoyltransferase
MMRKHYRKLSEEEAMDLRGRSLLKETDLTREDTARVLGRVFEGIDYRALTLATLGPRT